MTPEERQLISGLFERMRSYGAPDKDRDAEALIAREVRANPDATYMLVQSVLVQEQALEASNNRVQDLEDQLRAMEGGGEQRGARSGGFLGGAWNSGRRDEEPRSSGLRWARGQRRLPMRAVRPGRKVVVHPRRSRRRNSRRPPRRAAAS